MGKILRTLVFVGLFLSAGISMAQNNRYYNSRGQYIGRSRTSGKTTYYYNKRGYYTGRSRVYSGGQTRYWNNRGYYRGRSSKPSRSFYRGG